MVKTPKVFTMDELMRLPSVSRFHFIECGANTGMEWGNVAVPTCQYSHGMISCSEFTGVPLKVLLDMAASTTSAALRAGRGRRRLVDDAHHPDGAGRVGRGASWPTARTARCCAPRTAIRCAWWCRACRA
jgi:DMSO/TMAO reductase YedYZ molybdopterin-dependent catalytic subunit